ncbi:hypothetical protein [Streptomyces blattellae]|uniref:hypothetical protein n=1 Tax=Streptomyces blattellae TaxID=2569855 RepID=UPI0012B86440|nr:hypothetical protein [Streptomyces blattellae]
MHTRRQIVDVYGTVVTVTDHTVSAVVPVRATPDDSGFRRAAVLTCEECGEDFRVGYVSRSEALRRFCRSCHLWTWLVVLTGYVTTLGFTFTAGGLLRDPAQGEPAAIFALLGFGVCGILPVARAREDVRDLNRDIVWLADSEAPPPEERHDWIRTRDRGTDGTRSAEPTPE